MSGNERVAAFVNQTTWGDLPSRVRSKVKLALLDALGAVLSGTLADITQISARFATRAMSGDEASLLLLGSRATAAGAAFVNANAANAFDSDDVSYMVRGHIGAQVIPAALAVAETYGRSGRELLSAIAVAYEVAYRVAPCWHEHHTTWRAGGSWGSLPNAAAAAKLMELDQDQTQQALGIAEYHAPLIPIMRAVAHPAMVKHGMGWGAMNGIMAVELAEAGYTGVPSLLGFDEFKDRVANIGEVYYIETELAFKGLTGCAFAHPAIYAVRRIRQQHSFSVDDIETIRIGTFSAAAELPTEPPTTTENAQFSVTWPVACELTCGEFGPVQQLPAALADKRTIALAERICVAEDPECTRLLAQRDAGDAAGKVASKVTITLKNGTKFDQVHAQDAFGLNLAEDAIVTKFRWLAQSVLPGKRVEGLVEMILALDQVASVADLTRLVQ